MVSAEYMREYRKKNPESIKKLKIWEKKRVAELKIIVLDYFGNVCCVCQENQRLQLHHEFYIDDKKKRTGYGRIYEALRYPERFRLLCTNCHNEFHENGFKKGNKFGKWCK